MIKGGVGDKVLMKEHLDLHNTHTHQATGDLIT